MKSPTPMLTLTNDHLCSHTDGGKSTYVFHTSPIIVLPQNVELNSYPKDSERVADGVQLDRK
jgi:hypothetical protein